MKSDSRVITEARLSDFVKDAATTGGWVMSHFRPARTDQGWRTPIEGHKGFPDWVFVHPVLRLLVIAELKSERGKLSPDQELWIETLQKVLGVETYVWRPSDMPEIRRVLLGHLQLRGG